MKCKRVSLTKGNGGRGVPLHVQLMQNRELFRRFPVLPAEHDARSDVFPYLLRDGIRENRVLAAAERTMVIPRTRRGKE